MTQIPLLIGWLDPHDISILGFQDKMLRNLKNLLKAFPQQFERFD